MAGHHPFRDLIKAWSAARLARANAYKRRLLDTPTEHARFDLMAKRGATAQMASPLEGVLCLDFEASGLGRNSYPIEVAVVDCGTMACISWLIRPTEDWLLNGVWSDESGAVHQIALTELMSEGRLVADVAQELADHCRGKIVLCDGGEYDRQWLEQLFASADHKPAFKLSDFAQFARELAMQERQDPEAAVAAAQSEALSRIPTMHRASADARRLAATLRLIAGYL